MAHEVPRPSFRQYSALRAVQLWRLEEDAVGHFASDVNALAAGEWEMLLEIENESNRQASQRAASRAVSALFDECPKALPRHCAQWKTRTSDAPYA